LALPYTRDLELTKARAIARWIKEYMPTNKPPMRRSVDPTQLWRRGLTLFGSWVYELGEYEGTVRLADKRAEALEKIVTRRFDGTGRKQPCVPPTERARLRW
jgi:hypothetical protein